ncbi:MAG: hypothetical protein WD793_05620 [Steroidobacteraceae bacterium]
MFLLALLLIVMVFALKLGWFAAWFVFLKSALQFVLLVATGLIVFKLWQWFVNRRRSGGDSLRSA